MAFIDQASRRRQDEIFNEIEVVDKHFHSNSRWFGKSADQSGNDWAVEVGLTSFQAISGNGDFGSDLNDEAKVIGSADTPVQPGKLSFDLHQFMWFVWYMENQIWRLPWRPDNTPTQCK